MSKYTFPDKPILPVPGSRKLRHAVDAWRKLVKQNQTDYFNTKTFKKIIDEAILNDVVNRAQKIEDEEAIKEFLEDVSTKIGEDE